MSAVALERCWNHSMREAVCRCPGCGRFYCRECVTEHDARLLCAACVAITVSWPRRERLTRRKLLGPAAGAAGLSLAWLTFYAAARFIAEMNQRAGEQQWRPR